MNKSRRRSTDGRRTEMQFTLYILKHQHRLLNSVPKLCQEFCLHLNTFNAIPGLKPFTVDVSLHKYSHEIEN